MKPPRLTDTTLRDGSHAVFHSFSKETITTVVRALDKAGVPVIEVSHGAGLGGSTIQEGFSKVPEYELIETAVENAGNAKIAVVFGPGVGTIADLRRARDIGVKVVRIVSMCSEADTTQQHFTAAKEMGYEAVGFLMMSHLLDPEKLAKQAQLMESYGCDCVYIVDSAGTMMPNEIRAKVRALKSAVKIQVGIHTHNNLGVAVGNTLAAVEEGVDQIDGSLRGLGAGAGNAMTEVLVPALNKMNIDLNIDMFQLLDAAEYIIAPMHQVLTDKDNIILGYSGVYSSFLLHVRHVAEKFGLDPKDLIMELGRRNAVAGQEDWLYEVAVQLTKLKQPLQTS